MYLFEQIFDHKFETLTKKLINTTKKEENQIIAKNIEKNKDKLFETDSFDNDWVFQPSDQCIKLNDAINLILNFNKNKKENENDETLMPSDKDDDKMMIQN